MEGAEVCLGVGVAVHSAVDEVALGALVVLDQAKADVFSGPWEASPVLRSHWCHCSAGAQEARGRSRDVGGSRVPQGKDQFRAPGRGSL